MGQTSISLTACTGIYHAGTGFIGGGSIDLPIGSLILENFDDIDFISDNEEFFEAFEMRNRKKILSRRQKVVVQDGSGVASLSVMSFNHSNPYL